MSFKRTLPEYVIIANPTSGSQSAPDLATGVKALLEQAGHLVELRVTTQRGDAHAFACSAALDATPAVVACGGDGTLQEVASGLVNTRTRMGILPGGRCNDFAHALGLSKTDGVRRLADVLLAGKTRPIDVGSTPKGLFLTVATMGFDSEVSRFVETRKMWLKGTPAYLYAVLRTMLSFRAPRVILRGDFGTLDGRMLLAATGNASCYGGAMQIAPGAKLDDGLFQVCIVNAVSRLTLLRVLPKVLKGTHTDHPAVKQLSTAELTIETPDGPQWICADGETLGQTPMTLSVMRGALQVIVP